MDNICSNCSCWVYNKYTEENYGMGVGRCSADGSMQWCEHRCPFMIPKEDENDYSQ